ncbi:uncharacterized protein LOC112093792 [Morus notabilis]|uniref:uncharacterized protein LOC112093792 n=1 Tax=Morus notabilis TaxID=981085 RepID=UPI000CED2C7C|nr:uncharacterized protein LOC112093792 [Morus notabilis]
METFYNGLNASTRAMVDASANRALLVKTYNEAYEILERMSNNNYQWPTERVFAGRRVAGIHEVDAVTALTAQVSSLSNILKSLNVAAPANAATPVALTCVYCGAEHSFENCPSNPESVCYVNNFNRNNNPYSNSYNQGWKQHPNFSWSNQEANPMPGPSKPAYPPGFHQHQHQRQPPQEQSNQRQPHQASSTPMEALLKEYMARNDSLIPGQAALLQSQAASLRTLENQVGQLANVLSNRPQGSLPSDTKNPRRDGKEHCKEHCKAITLQNGREIEQLTRQTAATEHSSIQTQEVQQPPAESEQDVVDQDATAKLKQNKPERPPPPFPQRFQNQKQDKQFRRFLDVLKQLHINIPLVEALEQMPSYVKFMKDILTKKRRLGEFETVALTEECSAILKNRLPPKLKDPGSFTIPCSIGDQYIGKALCDLGASINLMPMSIFRKLGIGEVSPTTVTLQLADRSYAHPEGKIEDVLVRVDKFIFPADFIVLDYEADKEVPIILGRPFLATGKTLIDVQKGELTMRVHDQQVTFNVFKAMRFTDEVEECSAMNVLDSLVAAEFEKTCAEKLMTEEDLIDSEINEDNNDKQVSRLEGRHAATKSRRHFESLDLSTEPLRQHKPSVEEPPILELRPLPAHLRYAYLGDSDTLPVIIASGLNDMQEIQLLEVLKKFKRAIGWTIADIKGISPSICMHKILLQECCSNSVEQQRRLNPIMKEVVKKEVIGFISGSRV